MPGNAHKARIYLSMENRGILEKQLQETYGESIAELERAHHETARATLRLRKFDMPPFVVRQTVRTVVPAENSPAGPLLLERPADAPPSRSRREAFRIADAPAGQPALQQVGSVELDAEPDTLDLYTAAVALAGRYRLDLWAVRDELVRLDPETGRPVERAWRRDDFNGAEYYTAEIRYPKSKEGLLAHWEEWSELAGRFGFHYSPYNFDSNPESDFFRQLLGHLDEDPDHVEDVYFTGALTDPAKTEFLVEYRDVDGRWRRYTPDFIVRRKDGRVLIVEVKSARFEAATAEDLERERRGETPITTEGRKAATLKRWERLDPDRIRYEILFADEAVPYERWEAVREFVDADEPRGLRGARRDVNSQ